MKSHPFAEYVRILGKGKNGARSLTQQEAKASFHMILNNQVEDIQLGAYLMLLRVQEESPEEVAGFVQACHEHLGDLKIEADLDWSSYAGKRRHHSWYILAAKALADAGYKIFMHGASGHTAGRVYTNDLFQELGLPVANSVDEAKSNLASANLTYMPIASLLPRLHEIIELRPFLGLRSPVHTLCKIMNPSRSYGTVAGVFHPAYNGIHQGAAKLLQFPSVMIAKGEGGEFERNPDSKLKAFAVVDGDESAIELDQMSKLRSVKPENLDTEYLIDTWKADFKDSYSEQAVLGTMQLAIKAMKPDLSLEHCMNLARQYWASRNTRDIR